MQKRLIEEMAKCRGGPNRLKKLRKEFWEKFEELREELAEVEEALDLIDEVTAEDQETKEDKDAYQEGSEAVSEQLPVDSLGE